MYCWRRSLTCGLHCSPQPGQHRYNTRSSILPEVSDQDSVPQVVNRSSNGTTDPSPTAPTTQENQTQGVTFAQLRPRSMYQSGIASSQRTENSEKISVSRSMRPPASVSKLAEPQTIGLARSQSLRRPGAITKHAPTSGLAGHARTQSTSTIPAARRDIPKPNTGLERPKSLLVAPSRASKTNGVAADTLPGAARTSARFAGLNRSTSTKTKPETKSDAPAISTVPRAEEPLTSQSRRREPVLEEPKKTNRPAFSTLQQHFTPRKVGKAPTATFLHPAPAPASHSLPPELISLQSELLQLHLLHQSSAETSKLWELSARHNLHIKFEEVASLYQVMLENERAGQEQKNLQSLLEWSAGGSSTGLVEHIQFLSEPLQELPSLVESGGRLQRLVGEFAHWLSWVQGIRSARQSLTGNKDGAGTIEGLEDTWKAENAALTRKLTLLSRDLGRLAQPTPGSSIACIVEACATILLGILEELQIMQKIEAEVVTKEKDWVESRLRAIAVGTYALDVGDETAAWRM
jgi:hypothetical protein